jgi:hypothetical protein
MIDIEKFLTQALEMPERFFQFKALDDFSDGGDQEVPGFYIRGLTGQQCGKARAEAKSGDFFDAVLKKLLSESPAACVEGLKDLRGTSGDITQEDRYYMSLLTQSIDWEKSFKGKVGDDQKVAFIAKIFRYYYIQACDAAKKVLDLSGIGGVAVLNAKQCFKKTEYQNALALCSQNSQFLYQAYPHLVNGANFVTDFEQTLWSEWNRQENTKIKKAQKGGK